MFRRSAMLVLGLLSTAAVGAAVAQTPAPSSKPKTTMPASQDTAAHKPGMKAAAKPTWTKDQIKTAQVGLVKAGLYKGDTNGVMNGATRKALRAYQKQNKLPVTGRLNDEVLAKLKAS
jgi:peptidoglycan hydrolase-like protein with peptidoglycan-binding domain